METWPRTGIASRLGISLASNAAPAACLSRVGSVTVAHHWHSPRFCEKEGLSGSGPWSYFEPGLAFVGQPWHTHTHLHTHRQTHTVHTQPGKRPLMPNLLHVGGFPASHSASLPNPSRPRRMCGNCGPVHGTFNCPPAASIRIILPISVKATAKHLKSDRSFSNEYGTTHATLQYPYYYVCTHVSAWPPAAPLA